MIQTSKDIPRATLSDLLARSVPYERWRAPLDPHLKMLTWLSGAALLIHLFFLWLTPNFLELGNSGFFLLLGNVFHGLITWIESHALLLLGLNVAALGVYLFLLWRTRGLQAAGLTWHQVAFGEVVTGAAGVLPMAVSLAIILVNVALWIVLIIVAIVLGVIATIVTLWLIGAILGALLEA